MLSHKIVNSDTLFKKCLQPFKIFQNQVKKTLCSMGKIRLISSLKILTLTLKLIIKISQPHKQPLSDATVNN